MTPDTPAGPPRPTVAAVDLGSNSFHMVIARLVEPELQILDRLREPVRLAAGLGNGRKLDRKAKARAIEALERLGQRLRDLPSERVRAVGTSTLRVASTDVEFRKAARRALGHPIEVISGEEEARLIYQGIAHSHPDGGGRRLAVDIGGGSTEIMVGDGFELVRADSRALGCVTFSRRFFPDGQIDRDGFRQAQTAVALELRSEREAFRKLGWRVAVGSSGTVHAIAELIRDMDDGGDEITLPRLKRLRRILVDAGSVEALDLEGLRPDRAPVLPGGLAILIGIFKNLQIETMEPAAGALREGVLFDLAGRLGQRDVRDRTIRRLVDRFHVDLAQADRIRRTALRLVDGLGDSLRTDPGVAGRMLTWASLLHEIGLVVAHAGFHKHGAYLAANTNLPGFSDDDQEFLALLVRGHRRRIPLAEIEAHPGVPRDEALELLLLLRLAVILHRSRSDTPVPTPSIAHQDKDWQVRFGDGWLDEHPLTRADLEAEAERWADLGWTLGMEPTQG